MTKRSAINLLTVFLWLGQVSRINPLVFEFFRRLGENNNREWFEQRSSLITASLFYLVLGFCGFWGLGPTE